MYRGKRIVLASASPRRKEILEKTGLIFRVDPGGDEEEVDLRAAPRRLSRVLSLQKAMSVAGRHKGALIIAADTFIVVKGMILGKPHTAREARRMLRVLNGRKHTVITGFTILDTASDRKLSRSVQTKVYFRHLSPEEIDSYIESGEPLDKAGAYAIQGLGAALIRSIEGDYFNVVGLPLNALVEELKKFGIRMRDRRRKEER
ncbi:MAG TPA: Maf family protein [Thermodesulfovibrionales bacterium]|nr:Maf family protein [Thermodesulfovibrionales bacterium]